MRVKRISRRIRKQAWRGLAASPRAWRISKEASRRAWAPPAATYGAAVKAMALAWETMGAAMVSAFSAGIRRAWEPAPTKATS